MASVDAALHPYGGLYRSPLLLNTDDRYVAVKDPCPVRLGDTWHLFGTGVYEGYRYEILHATSRSLAGPWRLEPAAVVPPLGGSCVAAPGVVAEGRLLHMFLQTDYNLFDGRIEHLVSDDHGANFRHAGTALRSVPGGTEAGIYDAHPCEIAGERYLVYSAFATPGRPDVHLAHSPSGRWAGPWDRLGPLLLHDHVPEHNQHDDPAYEWGLEGGQLIELPDGRILLNAVCFLGGAAVGDRQRVFFGLAARPTGPYGVTGPVLHPAHGAGEVGHAAGVVDDDELVLFFQERTGVNPWHYALATATLTQPQAQTAA